MKTIAFNLEEEKELLSILPQKYKDRIINAYSFYVPTGEILNIQLHNSGIYWSGYPPKPYVLINNGNQPSGIKWI